MSTIHNIYAIVCWWAHPLLISFSWSIISAKSFETSHFHIAICYVQITNFPMIFCVQITNFPTCQLLQIWGRGGGYWGRTDWYLTGTILHSISIFTWELLITWISHIYVEGTTAVMLWTVKYEYESKYINKFVLIVLKNRK